LKVWTSWQWKFRRGGTGTHAIEKEAKLMLWDKKKKKVFDIVPVRG
jgi:hypothetical protein